MVVKQTSVFRIHDAVLRVSEEAKKLWQAGPTISSERALLANLILCLLSSQERYEIAIQVHRRLIQRGLLRAPMSDADLCALAVEIRNTICEPIKSSGKLNQERRIRFCNHKARFTSSTLKGLYLDGCGLDKILEKGAEPLEVRRKLVTDCPGIGPKQASMFLRNVRFNNNLAILDKHVIDYMKIMAIGGAGLNFSRLSNYEKTELSLQRYADSYKVDMVHLDIAIWTTMRVLKGIH